MPGYTSPKNIPYPLPSEPPNGSAQMLALADKVDDLLVASDSARSSGDAAITSRLSSMNVTGAPVNPRSIESHLADVYTKIPTEKVKWGESVQVTTDANGRIGVNHNAGWFPRIIVVTAQVPGTTRKAIFATVDGDSVTSTYFAVWLWDASANGWYANKTCGLNWILRD